MEEIDFAHVSIFIIDDDPVMRGLLEAFFTKKGCIVTVFKNAESALEVLQTSVCDLIILDHLMEKMTGLEFIQTLKAQNMKTAVVMLSGADDPDVAIHALQSGALDFVAKDNATYLFAKLEQAVLRALHVIRLEARMSEALERQSESEKRYRQLFNRARAAMMIIDLEDGSIVEANQTACDFYGYLPEEMGRLNISDINQLGPDEIHEEMELAKKEKRNHFNFVHRLKDGSTRDVEVHSGPIELDGKTYLYSIIQDVSQRKKFERELRLAQQVFETTSEAIVVTDADNKIQAVNPSFTFVTGYDEEEVIGRDPGFLSSGRQDGRFYDRMWARLEKKGRWQGEIWNRRKNGDIYPEWLSISAVKNSQGRINHYVAVFSDISRRKKDEALIQKQANYDALTNLPNRSLFLDRLNRAMVRAKRNGQQVALMFLDLDRFKWVNDTLGHNIGDSLLQEVAQRLEVCVRETDTVARLGGDEFTIIIPDITDGHNLQRLIEKILEAAEKPFMIEGHEIFISTSIGISLYPQDAREIELLLRNADTAMYKAKEQGRNGYSYFTADMNEQISEQMALVQDLRRAVEKQQFVVYYQPVISRVDKKVTSAEALVRWNHPVRGLLPPGVFIGVAEETGLITEIGHQVLEQVCRQLKQWDKDPVLRDLKIAVNLSTHQLKDESLLDDLKDLLRKFHVRPECLGLEITESLVMSDPDRAAGLLEEIRNLGITISLDDFGTGYSSLNYLKRFSFDYLKIDKSFIQDLDRDGGDATLVEAIVAMAHKLEIKVIAEGVENTTQRDFVDSYMCDFIQGFFYSKPIAPQDFIKYCRKAENT